MIEGVCVGYIIHHDDAMDASEVTPSQRSESLLTGSIPLCTNIDVIATLVVNVLIVPQNTLHDLEMPEFDQSSAKSCVKSNETGKDLQFEV